MLELMRKHAGSWIIKILLGAIAVAFALSWGVSSYYGRATVAVKVNDEPITMTQLQEEHGRLSEEARRQLGAQFDKLAQLLNLKERALNRLVDRTLLSQAATQLGVAVSDVEVRARVASMEAFSRDGHFDLPTYQRTLSRNRLTPEMFEGSLRGEMTMERLNYLVAGAAQITPLELDQALTQSLTQVQAAYLIVKPVITGVAVSQEELAAYYQEHKRTYVQPEKVRFSYLVFPLSAFRNEVQISDDDLADAYEAERARYVQQEAVRARHILIAVKAGATPEADEAARKQAEEVLALAKAGKESFANLAKKHSQGPTASTGGNLGLFQRGEMVGPLEELAFGLKENEVGMVRAEGGYHLLKVEEHRQARVRPLEEVRGELRQRIEEERARDKAELAAEQAFNQVGGGVPLAQVAKSAKVNVAESPLITADEEAPGLPGLKGIVEGLEGLMPGQAAPAVSFEGGSVLAVLAERVGEQQRPLEEVKEEVRAAVAEAKAQRQAQEEAQSILTALAKESDPAAALLKRKGAVKTAWLGLEDDIPNLNPSAPLVRALLERPQTSPALTAPVEAGGGYAVAAASAHRQAEVKDLADRREQLRTRLLGQKRQEALQRFLEDLRAKANIKIMAQL